MTNLFIALSNNQVSNSSILAKEMKHDKNILITSRKLNFNEAIFSKVICVEQSFNNQSTGVIKSVRAIIAKIKSYKKIVDRISYLKNEKDITIYFSYIEDILTNYLLFSFNKNVKGVVVEDGTLNYYSHTINSISKLKIYSKWLLSKWYGIPFILYKGHSSGIEYDFVKEQYVRSPEISLFPEKSKQLKFSKRYLDLSQTILVVGQEAYINMYGKEMYLKRLKELIEIITESDSYSTSKKIYYKPHRHGGRVENSFISNLFGDKEVVFLDSDAPLEDLYFNQLKSKHIFGFDSSVFLNIYLETDEAVRNEINFNVLLVYNKKMKPIFNRFNFNIFE
ncbi:hypothetical protein KFZ70_05430 [Tamlana fucoidanivorans]|uniref:Uncharacterized protein n=1 Tax=Allotamlana fucoidanivorans TaxID=2583814 RepID=A0A5C4SSE8_9FLAO|nr:hypothetical protein [Tamlana fucoidanivorans]TNJ47048.1 hypothetical protein FGF67_00545 [Tamlana fucoidanivorans]